MNKIKDEYAVWINAYPGSCGYVVKTFDNEYDADEFAKKHTGVIKYGGHIERTFTSRTMIQTYEPEVVKVTFSHVNRRR